MSIAALIRRMSDAGAPPEAIAIAVEAIEDAQSGLAAKRAKDAERKARQRAGTVTGQSRDSHGTNAECPKDTPSLNDALPNLETLEVNLNPPPLTPRPSKTDFPKDAFDRWYAAYPRKVAPKAARKAFVRVERSGEVTFAELMAGTGAYARSVVGKETAFIA